MDRFSSAAFYLFCILSSVLWNRGYTICDSNNCSGCISVDDTCGWCQDEGVRLDNRCREFGTDNTCNTVFFPTSNIDNEEQVENLRPSEVEISLRANNTLPVEIRLNTSRSIPLDVYILFDVSQSMREEIEAVQEFSNLIIGRLSTITDDVIVGVGSYIDKRLYPFSRVNLNNPQVCRADGSDLCYDFRHYGPMTKNTTELDSRFAAIATGANIDAPEAGFDAMAQVAICDREVGWRDDSVKIILYFTDDAFKFAGEGRQAGILTPFDSSRCGLEMQNEFYIYEGLMNDYPSPGELLSLLAEKEIVPVFISVTSTTQAESFYDVTRTHEGLAELFNMRLGGRASSANVDTSGQRENVATNILNIIDTQVLLILQQTGLDPPEVEGLRFTVEAVCPPDAMKQNNGTGMESCTNVGVGNLTVFTLSVTLEDCTSFNTSKEINVQVRPLGTVVVRVTPICTCNCGDLEVNSPRCSGNGNYSCGECICKPDYCGHQCQFKITTDDSVARTCPVGIGGEECSGDRGECVFCECLCSQDLNPDLTAVHPDIRASVNVSAFGEACECDYFSCYVGINATEYCSGRGDCCNGRCRCHTDSNGYQYRSDSNVEVDIPRNTELDCLCEPAEIVCRMEGTQDPFCSGVVECGCDGCDCPVPYTGRFCETPVLTDCNLATESEVEKCILAEKDRSDGDRRRDNCATKCSFSELNNVDISCVLLIPPSELNGATDSEVESAVVNYAAQQLDGTEYGLVINMMCPFTDNDSCTHFYYIVFNKNNISDLVIVAERDRECPSTGASAQLPIPLWALAIILLGLLLILGIVILFIIKMIFLLLDYFEVKRLEKEVGLADFSKNQNPLYQSPEMEYKNVAYGKE